MAIETAHSLFTQPAHNPSFESVCAQHPTRDAPIDFCVPVNRHFPPTELVDEIREQLPSLLKFYPEYADVHQQLLADTCGVPAENIVVANGSTELITLLCQQCTGRFATCIPTFGRWTDLPTGFQVPTHYIQRHEEQAFHLSVAQIVAEVQQENISTLVLSNPNNPTGAVLTLEEVEDLVSNLSNLDLIIIDESFLDFSGISSAVDLAINHPNLVIVKSLGKSIGWHGIRLGYAVAHVDRASQLRSCLPYWNINGIAEFVLRKFNTLQNEFQNSLRQVRLDRKYMAESLSRIPTIQVFPSSANFLYVKLPTEISGKLLRDNLLHLHGLLIRECSNKKGSTEQYLRLAVNLPHETDKLVNALR